MLVQRLLVANILVPVLAVLIILGGWPYSLLVLVALALAGWEYWRIFCSGGYSPPQVVVIGGIVVLTLARSIWGFDHTDIIISLLVLVAMSVAVFWYESGHERCGSDFSITLGGIFYLGWLGPYLISLRNLPDGMWWTLVVLPAVWMADTGAYFIGRRFGKHKMSPRVSPKKSWEGYFGGILFGIVFAALFASLWHLRVPVITPFKGAIIGLIMAVVTPLGDLGESMIKRQFGFKDSSNLLPGHGGVMDRIDSWIWAAAIGYYLVGWLV
jgi:phosphatidate cytidylyltransferase